jgi:hypothetical protein
MPRARSDLERSGDEHLDPEEPDDRHAVQPRATSAHRTTSSSTAIESQAAIAAQPSGTS